ncbi:hypothetical protein K493DRAFT_408029 [Basidiobolus meristosporus CBS 931.73]|uniref:Uncharacterized protein n=1 Tax=Basidiobolus meristosporus CBS 931.73 TaxID=1314790 RepID=A0A1Y1Y8K4_9FUNG|nr:hypothetical protein K493DRAFT_408029 [Basidiobolus meristosporus CBS 931.73]|eukprot:ORX94351.1 hypothetical protein K493DRAFT_408029 [Basidiobolus meristosporus CBS 931.73]
MHSLTSPRLFLTLAIFIRLATAGPKAEHCQPLIIPSKLCPEVNYATTIQDVEVTDAQIKTSLDKMSREGYESAGAECFLAIRKALCFMNYDYCDPETFNIHAVCREVRQRAVSVCNDSQPFTDINVIDENINATYFRSTADCYPNGLQIDTNATMPLNTRPLPATTSTAEANLSLAEPTSTENPTATPEPNSEEAVSLSTTTSSTYPAETTNDSSSPSPYSTSELPQSTAPEMSFGLKYRQGSSGILSDLTRPPVDGLDPAYSFSTSLYATILALVVVGVCVLGSLALVLYGRKYSLWNLSYDSLYGQYKKMEDSPSPYLGVNDSETFVIEEE